MLRKVKVKPRDPITMLLIAAATEEKLIQAKVNNISHLTEKTEAELLTIGLTASEVADVKRQLERRGLSLNQG